MPIYRDKATGRWRFDFDRYIDDDIRANRERADDAALRDAAPPRPSLIRVGRRWWHDAAAKVALYVALVRAGLTGRLR
jgi:hypothetical protein